MNIGLEPNDREVSDLPTKLSIGLALSGGGVRAAVFHLGVLARLAFEKRLEDVTAISTVSGGSLGIGLVYALNGMAWPTSVEYLDRILPEARAIITSKKLQSNLILRVLGRALRHPSHLLATKADDLSALLRKNWGIRASLKAVPEKPRWMINATCYETAKNWRFLPFLMGDYEFGYTEDTDIPLSDALAASAGFPGLIGPLVFHAKRRGRTWFQYVDSHTEGSELSLSSAGGSRRRQPITPRFKTLHLWDGGVYDNLGAEALHDIATGWRHGVDFLIVSDASGCPAEQTYSAWKALLRIIIGVMMDQIRSLRSRVLVERMVARRGGDRGAVLRTGNTCRKILGQTNHAGEVEQLCSGCLSEKEAARAAHVATTLKRLPAETFELLFRHGFEVADYTLYGYNDDEFGHVGHKAI